MKNCSKRKRLFAAAGLLAVVGLPTGPLTAQTALSADGVVESTSGGFKFPDGSVQLTAAAGGAAPTADTGQTGCWDDQGTSRTCTGTGEDGENQAGVSWPTPRFTDNGDGTVKDNLTGLDWLQDVNCPGMQMGWQAALTWVESTLNAGSTACTNYTAGTFSDWRLPNIRELSSLVDFSRSSPALPAGHPFVNVQLAFYWSSTSNVSTPGNAFSLNLWSGRTSDSGDKDSFSDSIWPVRGGQ